MSESTTGGLVALGLLALAIYSCSGSSPSTTSQTASLYSGSAGSESNEDGEEASSRDPFDEDDARRSAEDELASSSYEDEGSPYGCTDDCSGHEAGWRWRAERGVQGYNADSPSFEEGGRAFEEAVDEKVEEQRAAYEEGE